MLNTVGFVLALLMLDTIGAGSQSDGSPYLFASARIRRAAEANGILETAQACTVSNRKTGEKVCKSMEDQFLTLDDAKDVQRRVQNYQAKLNTSGSSDNPITKCDFVMIDNVTDPFEVFVEKFRHVPVVFTLPGMSSANWNSSSMWHSFDWTAGKKKARLSTQLQQLVRCLCNPLHSTIFHDSSATAVQHELERAFRQYSGAPNNSSSATVAAPEGDKGAGGGGAFPLPAKKYCVWEPRALLEHLFSNTTSSTTSSTSAVSSDADLLQFLKFQCRVTPTCHGRAGAGALRHLARLFLAPSPPAPAPAPPPAPPFAPALEHRRRVKPTPTPTPSPTPESWWPLRSLSGASGVWASTAHTRTALHHDRYRQFLVQLAGTKVVSVAPSVPPACFALAWVDDGPLHSSSERGGDGGKEGGGEGEGGSRGRRSSASAAAAGFRRRLARAGCLTSAAAAAATADGSGGAGAGDDGTGDGDGVRVSEPQWHQQQPPQRKRAAEMFVSFADRALLSMGGGTSAGVGGASDWWQRLESASVSESEPTIPQCTLRPGQVLWIPPRMPHDIYSATNSLSLSVRFD